MDSVYKNELLSALNYLYIGFGDDDYSDFDCINKSKVCRDVLFGFIQKIEELGDDIELDYEED